jgi:hypothetical protein
MVLKFLIGVGMRWEQSRYARQRGAPARPMQCKAFYEREINENRGRIQVPFIVQRVESAEAEEEAEG